MNWIPLIISLTAGLFACYLIFYMISEYIDEKIGWNFDDEYSYHKFAKCVTVIIGLSFILSILPEVLS